MSIDYLSIIDKRLGFFLSVVLAVMPLAAAAPAGGLSVRNLRCEYRLNPQGIDVPQPRLSWVLESNQRGQKQTACQLLVASSSEILDRNEGDLWDSGKVGSADSIQVVYRGRPLKARMRCYWKVRVWDRDGQACAWSSPAEWSMGLLQPTDWQAQWITSAQGLAEVEAAAKRTPHNGYHSALTASIDDPKWVAMDLGKEEEIDGVRLYATQPFEVPPLPGYLFPVRFKIEVADQADFSDARAVVDRTAGDFPNPGMKPVAFSFAPVQSRHVRLSVTKMAKGPYGIAFTLAEMQVLGRGKNLAQGALVTALDSFDRAGWGKGLLTDGRIEPDSGKVTKPGPVPMFRKEFRIDGPLRRATAYVTALGCYQLRLNGRRVGDDFLTPQWTDYSKRVLYQTYDVTGLLKPGLNAAGALLADGWYRMRGMWQPMGIIGTTYGDGIPRVRVQIECELDDGSRQIVVTDNTWKGYVDGPFRSATMYDGVSYDSRLEVPGWDQPGIDDSAWKPAVIKTPGWPLALSAQPNPSIQFVAELRPVAMTEPEPGIYVCDLGQNISGFCRVTLDGPAGTTVRLRHAEALDAKGMIYTNNLAYTDATDLFILKGDGPETFQPDFIYHGFRYVELTGLLDRPSPDSLVGIAICSQNQTAGFFECSDPVLNQLWQNILWTYRDNTPSVVTDCAGRNERFGWMGDGQASWQTICFALDAAAFGTKWIQDMRDAQAANGLFSVTSPGSGHSPAWSDAGVIIPWTSYLNYGDQRLIELTFPAAKRYVNAVLERNPNYLWQKDRGADFNDWLDAKRVSLGDQWIDSDPNIPTLPQEVFATAFWANSSRLVAKMAAVLGRAGEASEFSSLADKIRDAFVKAYVDSDGRIRGDRQSCYALALAFDLLDAKGQRLAIEHLLEAIEAHDNLLSTGIHSSKRMLLALSQYGHHDLACRLALNPRMPSWRYMVDQRATTIWERFDSYRHDKGFNAAAMNDLNHVGLSSVGEWMWRSVVGLNPDEANPGYRHFVVHPRPGGGLTWATGKYESIRGWITSSWRVEPRKFTLQVTVPPNATATVYVPAASLEDVSELGKPPAQSDGVKFLRIEDHCPVFAVESGRYDFAVPR
ncbi:MAG: family 78 glycoside hydrolase catalytic domain [Candidatus Omnitrophica bacterium]|nr:family 78 glycoside hydrolase catalytic domain [Candidatus Omnitrophota bacterium]